MEFSADGSKVVLVSTAAGFTVRDTETYVAGSTPRLLLLVLI